MAFVNESHPGLLSAPIVQCMRNVETSTYIADGSSCLSCVNCSMSNAASAPMPPCTEGSLPHNGLPCLDNEASVGAYHIAMQNLGWALQTTDIAVDGERIGWTVVATKPNLQDSHNVIGVTRPFLRAAMQAAHRKVLRRERGFVDFRKNRSTID